MKTKYYAKKKSFLYNKKYLFKAYGPFCYRGFVIGVLVDAYWGILTKI